MDIEQEMRYYPTMDAELTRVESPLDILITSPSSLLFRVSLLLLFNLSPIKTRGGDLYPKYSKEAGTSWVRVGGGLRITFRGPIDASQEQMASVVLARHKLKDLSWK